MTTPLRKAALVLSSLAPADAERLRRRLDPRSARRLASEVARLQREQRKSQRSEPDDSWPVEQAAACWEFATAHPCSQLQLELAVQLANRKLRVALPSNVQQSPSAAWVPQRPRLFEPLGWVDPRDLGNALREEQPQTLAVVLAHAPPAVARELFRQLPTSSRVAVLVRVAGLETVPGDVLRLLEQALLSRLNGTFRRPPMPDFASPRSRRQERITALVEALPESERQGLLKQLDAEAPQAAREVRQRLRAADSPTRPQRGSQERQAS